MDQLRDGAALGKMLQPEGSIVVKGVGRLVDGDHVDALHVKELVQPGG